MLCLKSAQNWIYGSWPISIPPMYVPSFFGNLSSICKLIWKKGAFWNGERLRRPKYTTFAHLLMCTLGHFRFLREKKTCFGTYFPIQITGANPKICNGKTGYNTSKNTFFRKKKWKWPMYTSGGGQKWCILDDEDARRSKKHFFSGWAGISKTGFQKMKGLTWGVRSLVREDYRPKRRGCTLPCQYPRSTVPKAIFYSPSLDLLDQIPALWHGWRL